MRNSVADRIKEIAKIDDKLYLIAGDAGLGVWDDFKDNTKQFINPGVNEQCDIGMAAGMALRGHKVIFYNIAPFVVMRPYEFVRNDICYQNLPVILVGTGSGITYAPAGMTHYVVEDIQLCRTMPNLDIFSPADPVEAVACFDYAYQSNRPSYIRIPKAGEPKIHSGTIDVTQPQIIHEGSDVLILLHGSIIDEIDKVLEALQAKGVSPTVATVPMLTSNFDYTSLLSSYKHLFTLEEHFADGGFGSMLLEFANTKGLTKTIHKIGIKNEYIHKIGNRDYLRAHYGIDAAGITQKIMEVVNG